MTEPGSEVILWQCFGWASMVGRNIVFDSGRFAPGTHEERRLITHELTHVVQQSDVNGIYAGQNKGREPV